jgi:glutamate dehydrogenase
MRTGKRTTALTIELSEAMNDLFDVVLASSLYENENVRRNVLNEYFPKTLLEKIGYETLCERIPETFLKAAFSKYLAAQYYYVKGTKSSVYEFYEFVSNYDHE